MEKTFIQSAPTIRDSVSALLRATESFLCGLLFMLIAPGLFSQTPGTQKWAFVTDNRVYSSPAIGSDGTIYVGSWDKKLYAVNPDGTKKWEFVTGSNVYSPAVGSDDHRLYALYGGSKGLAASSWPKFHANNQNTGLVAVPNSVKAETQLPSEFTLLSNFPNPFNPGTAIRFCLPRSCHPDIFICTVTGRRVKTLVNQTRDAGWHTVQWNGKNDSGWPAESGVYFCVLKSETHRASVKMVLMR